MGGLKILSLCFLCLFVANNAVAAPRMECSSPKYDFGTVIGGEPISHEFILTNRGDEPVKIAKIKNCCGVKSTIVPMEIAPGSIAVCKVVFTTRNRYGKQDKQILIASNDRKHPYYELKMVGTLLRAVEFSPRFVRLGTLLQDGSTAQAITATNLLDKAVVLESVSSSIKGITAEVAESAERGWTIRLRTSPPLALGKLNGSIQLNFSSGTVRVPVIGTVKPIIQVVPEAIAYSSRSTNNVERLVMLRSGDGRSFEVLSARLENAEGSVGMKQLSETRWQLKVAVVPDSLLSTSTVRVETSCKGQPKITVPLWCDRNIARCGAGVEK